MAGWNSIRVSMYICVYVLTYVRMYVCTVCTVLLYVKLYVCTQYFFGLLVSPVEDLVGFVSFDVPQWQLVDGLGTGRFSAVPSPTTPVHHVPAVLPWTACTS